MAVRLASVCRQWRQAAADAISKTHLRPRSDLPPQYLSPLLGQLVAGCNTIELTEPLLAMPNVLRFLEVALPVQLLIGDEWPYAGSAQHIAAVGAALARCTSVQRLRCPDQLLPPTWPPNLQDLTTGCLYHPYYEERLRRALLQSLQGLPCLARLTLRHFGGLEAVLAQPDCFAGLTALRQLIVHLQTLCGMQLLGITSLSAAVSRGIWVGLHLERLWPSSQDMSGPRQALWVALAQGSRLSRLQVNADFRPELCLVSAAEQQLLAVISCDELVFQASIASIISTHITAWLAIRSEQLYCRLSTACKGPLDCSLLTMRAGVFILKCSSQTSITGCPVTPPSFLQGWALVLWQPSSAITNDLPCFVPGPRGRLVWRNSHVSDAALERAFELLNL